MEKEQDNIKECGAWEWSNNCPFQVYEFNTDGSVKSVKCGNIEKQVSEE